MKVTGTISKAAMSLIFAIAAPDLEGQEQQSNPDGQKDSVKEPSRVGDGTEEISK